jgi:adenosylcobinamide-phosphate guanylyltransferase
MCGGRGTRLGAATEKPLLPIAGRPTVDRVADALAASRIEGVHAVTSPATPATREHLAERGLPVVDAPGEGYVADLGHALERVDTPVLTVVADLSLLDGAVVDTVLDRYDGGSLTVCVPVALKRRLGVSVDPALSAGDLAPTGLNAVGGDPNDTMTSNDPRLAVNVNRPGDALVAEAML